MIAESPASWSDALSHMHGACTVSSMRDDDERERGSVSETGRHLVEVVVEIIADRGFEALSVRAVAQQAGVSVGAVQHHFPSKSGMLLEAMREVTKRESVRFDAAIADADSSARRRALLDILLPQGRDDVTARIWLQLAARAAVDPELGAVYSGMWGTLRMRLAESMESHLSRPEDAPGRATELLALCDGLTLAVLAEDGAVTPESARAIAETWTASLH